MGAAASSCAVGRAEAAAGAAGGGVCMAMSCSGILSGRLQHKGAVRRPRASGARPSPSPATAWKSGKAALTFLSALFWMETWLPSGCCRVPGGCSPGNPPRGAMPACTHARAAAAAALPRGRQHAGPGAASPPAPTAMPPPGNFSFPGYKSSPRAARPGGSSHRLLSSAAGLGVPLLPPPAFVRAAAAVRGGAPPGPQPRYQHHC